MVANLSFNPILTTNALGSFGIDWNGYIQGTALNDPAVRYALAGGVLATTETIPMWGGVGIYENVPGVAGGPLDSLGSLVGRATSIATLTGFSVFDQDHAALTTPQSPVPTMLSNMSVHFYRFGSGARLALQLAPSLVSLDGGLITQQVSWDFNNQQLIPYVAAYPANVITAATWASTSGGQVTYTTTTAHGVAVGDYFTISGMTPAGYNGDFIAITGTTGSTLVAALAVNPGTETVLGTLVAGGGAVPCKILNVQIGNSMTVVYNSATGYTTWNRSGSTAIALI